MTVLINKLNLACGLIALAGIAYFAWSLVLAVQSYPDGYSLTENFLSDLGCTRTPSGVGNLHAAAYFNRSVILLGISLIPFFAAMPAVLETGQWLVRICGVLSAVGLIGIGLTPYDTHLAMHLVALGLWLIAMLVTVVGFLVSVDVSGRGFSLLVIGSLGVLMAICGYVFASSRSGHVVFQKILAIVAFLWLCVVLACVSVSTIQSISSRRAIVERQATKYFSAILRRHRR